MMTPAAVKNAFTVGRLPRPGSRPDGAPDNDTAGISAGWQTQAPFYSDGFAGPFAWTALDLVAAASSAPRLVTQVAAVGASSGATVSAALTQVLYLQESGNAAAISVTDIYQGQMGDCFLLSSIGELALFHPDWITNMIHANTDGTETVTLYRAANGSLPSAGMSSYTAATINVANSFPTNSVNSGATQDVFNGQKEIWVQVLEKAVATLCGGYNGIANGGNPAIAMEELTGCSANYTSPGSLSLQQLQTATAAGDLIAFDTPGSSGLPYDLYGDHAYMFQSVSTVNGTVMVNLLNPWGFDQPAAIPFSRIGSIFAEVDIDQFVSHQVINVGPSLAKRTADQTWTQGSHVSLTLAAGTFAEPSGQKLTYAATQANGQAIPSWLSFNAATMTFSGTVPRGMETLSLSVTATDASSLSCADTFSVAVPAAAPTLAHQTAAQTWTEGAALSFAVPADTFADPSGETLSYAATLSNGQALPSWLTLSSDSGLFGGTVGYTGGALSIKLTATDTSSLSAFETFQTTLVAPPPTLTDQTASQTWTAGQALSFGLAADTFTAVPGQTLRYTATLPAGLTIDASTGTIRGTVPVALGVYTIKVTATETSLLSASETFKASVVASAPTLANQTESQTWTANRPVSFTLPSATFFDPQGEKLSYVVSGLPAGLSFNATTLAITGTAGAVLGSYRITVTAKDLSGLGAAETFQATIAAVAPTVHQTGDQAWTANKAVSLSVASAFADTQGETLTYTAVLSNGKALPAGMTFNAATASFGGIAPTTLGALGITVTAKNQSGLSTSETFQAIVAADAPQANAVAAAVWTANKAVSFTLPSGTFVDPQGEKLTYAATMADGSALPAWLKFNSATGGLTGTAPVALQSLAFAVTATDQSGLSATETIQASVRAAAPTVGSQTGAVTWMAGKAVSLTLAANTFVDPQGEKMTYSATQADGSALPGGLTFNPATDAFSGTAPITPQTLGLVVTATDASGLSVSERFSATIQAGSPMMAHQTANQVWAGGTSIRFLLPAGSFADPQGASLSYAAFETGGADQTSWLHFDAGSAALAGVVPTGLAGTIGIKVVAADPYGLSASESFGLTFAASGTHPFAAGAPGATELLVLHG